MDTGAGKVEGEELNSFKALCSMQFSSFGAESRPRYTSENPTENSHGSIRLNRGWAQSVAKIPWKFDDKELTFSWVVVMEP